MNIDLNAVYHKSNNVAAREIEKEFMIVPLAPNNNSQPAALYQLNETGREIWEHMNGKISLNRLIKMMIRRYNTASADQIRNDVISLVQELLNRNIIQKV